MKTVLSPVVILIHSEENLVLSLDHCCESTSPDLHGVMPHHDTATAMLACCQMLL